MSFIDTYAETIIKPGHGFGSGATILKRIDGKAISGVEFTSLRLEDNFSGEKWTHLITEDGFEVTPAFGSYGEGIRWCVSGETRETRAAIRASGMALGGSGSSLIFTSNLSRAAEMITRVRATQEA